MSNDLFDEFPDISTKQWKQLIQFELNGADYNDTLIWKSNDDISVKPFYNADDVKTSLQALTSKENSFNICQTIFVADVNKSNQKATKIIQNGVNYIKFIIPSNTISIEKLIENIDSKELVFHFELLFLDASYVEKLTETLSNTKFYIDTDIISHLCKTGNWHQNLQTDFEAFQKITNQTNSILINTKGYQNAGANMVQQLGYALAHANEYLNYLENNDVKKPLDAFNFIFEVSVGSNYFFEIAKLRALRILWHTLAKACKSNTTCTILAQPSKRNKAIYDIHSNLLRTTTEYMSAALGGANTIATLPFDVIFKKSNGFSERMARNQLLILKNESYFDKVSNPADGAYYIESLTHQLAEKGLNLFKEIEQNGGILKLLKAGTIQRKIKESAQKEQEQFDSGAYTLVGTNKYQMDSEQIKTALELYPFVKTNARKTLIEPIIEKRLSENLEQARLNEEK